MQYELHDRSILQMKWIFTIVSILTPIMLHAGNSEIVSHAASFENNSEYQICTSHQVGESFDCLSFNKIAYHNNSDGTIIASIKDIVYVVPVEGQLHRQEMSSLAKINCADSLVSVQLDPKSSWTHWDYVKKGELIRNVMDKVCELQTELASNN